MLSVSFTPCSNHNSRPTSLDRPMNADVPICFLLLCCKLCNVLMFCLFFYPCCFLLFLLYGDLECHERRLINKMHYYYYYSVKRWLSWPKMFFMLRLSMFSVVGGVGVSGGGIFSFMVGLGSMQSIVFSCWSVLEMKVRTAGESRVCCPGWVFVVWEIVFGFYFAFLCPLLSDCSMQIMDIL